MYSTKCKLDVSFSTARNLAALATVSQSGKKHTSTRTGAAACLHSGSRGFRWRVCCGPLGAAAPTHVAFNLGTPPTILNQCQTRPDHGVHADREVTAGHIAKRPSLVRRTSYRSLAAKVRPLSGPLPAALRQMRAGRKASQLPALAFMWAPVKTSCSLPAVQTYIG